MQTNGYDKRDFFLPVTKGFTSIYEKYIYLLNNASDVQLLLRILIDKLKIKQNISWFQLFNDNVIYVQHYKHDHN